jgi:O-6-methylguanine DNA methyltransferase
MSIFAAFNRPWAIHIMWVEPQDAQETGFKRLWSTVLLQYKQKVMKTFTKGSINKLALKERISNTRLRTTVTSIKWVEWKADDEGTLINWTYSDTILGEVLVASTEKGVCFMGFTNGQRSETLADLRKRIPGSPIQEKTSSWQEQAIRHMNNPGQELPVQLHLKGTAFQLNVWRRLLQVPFGGLTTYKELGEGSGNARATGSAIGANPVCYILPCHRVVRTDGNYEGYYWGLEQKRKLLTFEVGSY